MGAKRSDGVRAATESSIEIDFYYRGVRCRERIKLAPTPRNLQFARNLRGQVLIEIEKGTFYYPQHFPDSKRARLYQTKPKGLVTIASQLDLWYAEKERQLEHSTLIGYRRIIDNVITPVLGKVALRDFKRIHAKELVAKLGEEVSAKRINNVLGPLRSMLAEALADDMIESNPLDGFKVVRRRKVDEEEDIDPSTPDEVKAILAHAEGQFRNYCLFDFATGLRTSELIALRWRDVDLISKTVRIQRAHVMGKTKVTKTNAGRRVVALIPAACAALESQRAYTQLAGEHVFLNPRTEMPWDGDRSVREQFWRRCLAAAKVRYRYPYQMRHTFASQALSAGENVMWVANQLGHKDWTVTAKIYARWIPSVAPEAGNKIALVWEDGEVAGKGRRVG